MWIGRTAKFQSPGKPHLLGSYLADALMECRAKAYVVDGISNGTLVSIQEQLSNGSVGFIHADAREPGIARMAVQDQDIRPG